MEEHGLGREKAPCMGANLNPEYPRFRDRNSGLEYLLEAGVPVLLSEDTTS